MYISTVNDVLCVFEVAIHWFIHSGPIPAHSITQCHCIESLVDVTVFRRTCSCLLQNWINIVERFAINMFVLWPDAFNERHPLMTRCMLHYIIDWLHVTCLQLNNSCFDIIYICVLVWLLGDIYVTYLLTSLRACSHIRPTLRNAIVISLLPASRSGPNSTREP